MEEKLLGAGAKQPVSGQDLVIEREQEKQKE